MPDGPRVNAPDYDDDFYAWTQHQAAVLRPGIEIVVIVGRVDARSIGHFRFQPLFRRRIRETPIEFLLPIFGRDKAGKLEMADRVAHCRSSREAAAMMRQSRVAGKPREMTCGPAAMPITRGTRFLWPEQADARLPKRRQPPSPHRVGSVSYTHLRA